MHSSYGILLVKSSAIPTQCSPYTFFAALLTSLTMILVHYRDTSIVVTVVVLSCHNGIATSYISIRN
jgi:hypothetical protein